jgi:carbonic anhydrase
MKVNRWFRFFPIFFTTLCLLPASSGSGSGITGNEALTLLKEGNARFAEGARTLPNTGSDRRLDTFANGQKPFVTILGCADSRVPPEHLFDAGIGDLFIIRVAGNVADTDEIGTVEYGVEHLGTPLLVVLGHGKCGAVTAVLKGDHVGGSIPALVDNILPAAEKGKAEYGSDFSDRLLNGTIELNVWQAIEDIFLGSAIVRELAEEGKLKVVGAVYDLDTGKVEWLGEHPDQKKLLEGSSKASAAGTHVAATRIPVASLLALIAGLILLLVVYLTLFFEKTKTVKVKGGAKLVIASLSAVAVLSAQMGLLFFDRGTGAAVMSVLSVLMTILFSVLSMQAFGAATAKYIRYLKSRTGAS